MSRTSTQQESRYNKCLSAMRTGAAHTSLEHSPSGLCGVAAALACRCILGALNPAGTAYSTSQTMGCTRANKSAGCQRGALE